MTDPKPDDPEPAPGLVTAGDPLDSSPDWEAKRTVTLRWDGAEATDPLRGLLVWHAGTSSSPRDRLGASIVEVAPASAP